MYLEGIKVVELATVLAGPSVGTFLAELGAEVLKVENKRTKGDVTRNWKLPSEDQTSRISAYFSSINWGKRHIFLDILDPEDSKTLIEHIKAADILLVNFKYGDDVKFGLEYKYLKSINPKLIVADLKGFKEIETRAAYDVVVQAETGYMFMNGTEEVSPLKMPVAMTDILAAHQLKEGILLALLERGKTGLGAHIETTLEESAIASLTNQATNWLMAEHIPQPIGSLHPNIAPYGDTFTCLDGKKIVLAIGSNAQFNRFSEILGRPDLTENELFENNQKRVENRIKLQEELAHAIKQLKRDDLLEQCIKNNVPAGAIKNMAEVFQTKTAQSMILESEMEGVVTKRVKSVAFKITH